MDEDDEFSMEISIPRLHSLSEHIGWENEDVLKLFEALVDRFKWQKQQLQQQTVHLGKWMAEILYAIEIHKIDATLKISGDYNVIQLVRDFTIDGPTLLKLLGSDREKDLEEILEDIAVSYGIHANLIQKVRRIVADVSKALLLDDKRRCEDGIEKTLFDLCKAVQAQTKADNAKNAWMPRYTQMASWCILALSQNSYLLQVGTGEGKSCIVAMFAAYKALRGQKVDIISSSSVLAVRDAEAWKYFYKQLGLTVDCNTHRSEEHLRQCYKCHIVYGTTVAFAADWLEDHFSRKDIRTDRKFECVIVDEVDSLILDKSLEFVYLGSTMPCLAMQGYDVLLSSIWFQVDQHQKMGFCQCLPGKEACIKSVEQTIRSDLQFLCPEITPEDSPIPGMQHFIQAKLRVWVQSAFRAKEMDLGKEYIIQGQTVVPVDYTCTGVVQNNMTLNDGLQQFLEMKHQVKCSNMAAITNFMSNVRLFRMYNGQVYGISGTLGNEEEIKMLQELYEDMQTCTIPSFKRRKLFEETGIIVQGEEAWLHDIRNAVQEKVSATSYRGERAVLVICETINQAKTIETVIKSSLANLSCRIKLYTNSNLDPTEITGRPLQPRDVIIATNLAGRGTDLKVSKEVSAAGGLFVLQTFLPLNIRVENQAFGRSARQGNPGSAQLIMCSNHFNKSIQSVGNTSPLILELGGEHVQRGLSQALREFITEENKGQQSREEMKANLDVILSSLKNPSKTAVKDAKKVRDTLVKERMSSYLREDIPKMIKKEALFSDYLKLLDELHKKHKDSKILDVIVESMHECWFLWLQVRFNDNETEETLKTTFRNAMKYVRECFVKGKSPSSALSFYTICGNKLRVQGRFGKSIEMYTRGVEENDKNVIALYNRALSVLHAKERGYIPAALQDLEKAAECVILTKSRIEENVWNVMRPDQPNGEKSGFFKQQQLKCNLLTGLKDNIDEAVQKLKNAHTFGKRVKISEYPVSFLLSTINLVQLQLFRSAGLHQFGLHLIPHLLEDNEELTNLEALGLTQVFCLETTISLSGFVSKIFS